MPVNVEISRPSCYFILHGVERYGVITTERLLSILTKCAPKSSDLDAMPTSLLLDCLDVVLPSMADIINDSLVSGVFPSFYKSAIVKPLLKISTLIS